MDSRNPNRIKEKDIWYQISIALEKAFWYLDSGCSYQATRDWLVKKTGREISFIGLRKIWLTRQARQEKSS